MQSSLDQFMCYVFYVEPSAGALAKTIEAACKLRFQKALDAHGGGEKRRSPVAKVGGQYWSNIDRLILDPENGR